MSFIILRDPLVLNTWEIEFKLYIIFADVILNSSENQIIIIKYKTTHKITREKIVSRICGKQ